MFLRRYLRFRLRTLLLLPLIFAFGWWWITLPQRTLTRLNSLVAANELADAAALIDFEPNYRLPPGAVWQQLGQPHMRPARRGFTDLLLARQPYDIDDKGVTFWVDTGTGFEHVMIDSVIVERGRIKFQWGLTMAEWIKQGK